MKSDKNLLLSALRGESVNRPPWVPFVGVHGGSLAGCDATAYLQDADRIVAGLTAAASRYHPDGLPVVFDLQLEAEVLGCDLMWAKETPPAVARHPLGDDYAIENLPTFSAQAGRLPVVWDAVQRIKAAMGESVALYGLLTGPLTLALHLRGEDVLLDMFDEDENVPRLLDYCAQVAQRTQRHADRRGPVGCRHAKAQGAVGLAFQPRGGGRRTNLRARALGIGRAGIEPRAALVDHESQRERCDHRTRRRDPHDPRGPRLAVGARRAPGPGVAGRRDFAFPRGHNPLELLEVGVAGGGH
jgi:hypothetical protein